MHPRSNALISDPTSIHRYTEVAEQAARAGGRILTQMLGRAMVREKAPKDLVTEADTLSQRVIREILLNAFPDHDFVGEEDADGLAKTATSSSTPRWIVDPLDGTANFVHGMPGYAVSIGLEQAGEILAGVVYDPRLDECFVGGLGIGSHLNRQPLRVSPCRELRAAMVAVSFPAGVHRSSPDIPRFTNVLIACHSLRRLGSAALNLCYLAAGRLDGYWSTSCKAWDVAAGVIIVREAGGIVTRIDGSDFVLSDPEFATSATQELHSEFLDALARIEST
jgi:myo-inositol-1(or 4)-monophosphatase